MLASYFMLEKGEQINHGRIQIF